MKPRFSPSCDRSCVKMADRFASRGYSLKKQTRWSNDKTIIELGYRKISWFVSVSQINYLPQPSAWSTHHWQNLTNHDKHITDKSRYFAQPGPIIANYLPTLLPNISLVPRRSRLGQSWTLAMSCDVTEDASNIPLIPWYMVLEAGLVHGIFD